MGILQQTGFFDEAASDGIDISKGYGSKQKPYVILR